VDLHRLHLCLRSTDLLLEDGLGKRGRTRIDNQRNGVGAAAVFRSGSPRSASKSGCRP
jgi:hypothetical protein